MDSPETWRWIWLVATALFVVGEVGTGGSLFLLPFAIGAFVAALLAFAGVGVLWEWVAFIGDQRRLRCVATNSLRKRLDFDTPQDGIGARRMLGQAGRVVRELPGGPDGAGSVMVGREEWRAESLDGSPIPEGAFVKVVEVRGTRLIVHPQVIARTWRFTVSVLLIVLVAVFVVLLVWVVGGMRIVRPYQRGIVERLGKYKLTVDPGLRLVVPFVDKIRIVDMREQVVDVPPQEVITKDNVVVSVDAIVFFEPTDPKRVVYNIMNFTLAVTKLAQTNLRNLVGDMQLDEALTSRDTINTHLREILDDATDKWGVKVVRVEIQRIDPPPDVMHSMHEQMKAERQRRALVTTADGRPRGGHRPGRGPPAVGHPRRPRACKQQQVLEAPGKADATRALADAERYRQRGHRRGSGHGHQAGVRRHPRRQPHARPAGREVPRGAGPDRQRPGHQDLPAGRCRRADGLAGRRGRAVQGRPGSLGGRQRRRHGQRPGRHLRRLRHRPAPTASSELETGRSLPNESRIVADVATIRDAIVGNASGETSPGRRARDQPEPGQRVPVAEGHLVLL